MTKKSDEGPVESKAALWTFLVVGLVLILTGGFGPVSGGVWASLPKAEILTGATLAIGAIASLLITW